MVLSLDKIQRSRNVAELLDRNQLTLIGDQVVQGYELDEQSRAEWFDTISEALEIAKQVMEEKDFPWPGASNIKYPLITQASIDYASRTLPELIQNNKVVKVSTVGNDPQNEKYARASRVAQFMSYDLTCRSVDWVEGTDKLLQILPVLGTVFKKTYYNEVERRICSDLCVPDKVVVNYGVQSLEAARRVTHLLMFYANDIIARQRTGIFLDKNANGDKIDIDLLLEPNGASHDADRPITILEQHCYLDLDEDGYKEPYIVTVHKQSKQVLRIISRFKNIEYNTKKEVVRIVPEQYFTDYHFIRSPDGGYYSMGFGSLLLPINKAINSLLNQLIDSGTLNNTQGGLISKNLRLKNSELRFKMGQFQTIDSVQVDDINKSIFPWPTKEPSQVLFNLLGLLIQVGKDLSSTTDILSGKQPAQNVASTTVSQLVEQGTKVFIAINKRQYRSFKREYKKLYDLYGKHLTQDEYQVVLDDPTADVKKDFAQNDVDIVPVADPAVSTETQRIQKAGLIQQLRTVDPREADKLLLQAMQVDVELMDKLLPPPDPNAPPPPEAQKILAEAQKLQAEAQEIMASIAKLSADATLSAEMNQLNVAKMQQEMAESEARVQEAAARVWKMQQDALVNMQKIGITNSKMQYEENIKGANLIQKAQMDDHSAQMDIIDKTLKNKELDIKAQDVQAKQGDQSNADSED